MYFNYRQLLFDLLHALWFPRRLELRINGHRARVLAMFCFCVFWMGGGTRWGLRLDRLLFPRFTKTRVAAPVFVVGNFRTGSSFLYRLLATDSENFSAIKTWEIYFAPSISQRMFYRGVWVVDRWLGGRFRRWVKRTSDKLLSAVKLHRIRLDEAEEDEALLLYAWSSLFNWFFVPNQIEESPLPYFDQRVPRWRQDKVLRFYRELVRRHLWFHGRQGAPRANAAPAYLAKNPAFSGKIRSLLRTFPDARFIYLARNPVDTANSTARWLSFAWRYFASQPEPERFRRTVIQMVRHWFDYPVAELASLDDSRVAWIRFEDLVERPAATITSIYERFGRELPPHLLDGIDAAAARDKSEVEPDDHEPLGLPRAEMESIFAEEMDRFGYTRGR